MWHIVMQEESKGFGEKELVECKHVKFFPSTNVKTGQVSFGVLKFPCLKIVMENDHGAQIFLTWSNSQGDTLDMSSPGRFSLVDPDWAEEDRILAEELEPVLLEVALREARRTVRKVEAQKQDGLFDRVLAWVARYTFELVTGINSTTRDQLAEVIAQFVGTPGQTLGELNEAVGFIFTPERANTIAVTELTRAYGEGVKAATEELRAKGWNLLEIWQTNNDDLVCDECGPLNETIRGEDWEEYPPLHPNCRCDVGTVMA